MQLNKCALFDTGTWIMIQFPEPIGASPKSSPMPSISPITINQGRLTSTESLCSVMETLMVVDGCCCYRKTV